MRVSVILLAVCLALGFAPAPLPKRAHDEARLCGDWELKSGTKQVPVNEPNKVGYVLTLFSRVKITPGCFQTYWSYRPVGQRWERWSLAVSRGRPGRVDLYDAETGEARLGIYKLDGDTLTICYREPGEGRPSDFHDREQWLLVLKRK